jgi:hypothetical protein
VIHVATGLSDTVGGKEAFMLPPMPDGSVFAYNMLLVVEATDVHGNSVATTLVMYTQNPLSFYYDGRYQLAQLYEPEPVSSCMPGGPNSRSVQYSDTNTQSESRQLTTTISQSFMNGVTHMTSDTLNNSWSTSDGQTYTAAVQDTSGWQNSSAVGLSNNQSTANAMGWQNTQSMGTSGQNQFSWGINQAQNLGNGVTVSWSNDTGNSGGNESNNKISIGADGKTEGGWDLGPDIKQTEGASGGYEAQGKATSGTSTGSSSGGNNQNTQSNTGGWSLGGQSSVGQSYGNSQQLNGTTTNTSGVTNSVLDTNQVSGSTATTDTTQASHLDTIGGGTQMQTSNGTSASESHGTQNSDAWTVTSQESIGQNYSGQIVADTFGVFYRQMARYTREAFVLEYDKCGDAEVVGKVTLQDFMWGVDLALNNQCPPMPPTNFPQSQCFMPPCTN